ncbi:hypothetical protein DIZ27_11005 [Streptomyces sp. NWU339]|uniref:hypothetical protein n=1 Tax=Streptomyces sp. NWU339 TaxID=2185284 RepID=UPI000D67A74A|nr:hypothetical protein [Streptomyces sp. NWU339]PWI10513.1 hypothetical protein DIZ27_11005 [Streptomyces sp. NWU339]
MITFFVAEGIFRVPDVLPHQREGPLHLVLPSGIADRRTVGVRDEVVDLLMFFLHPGRQFLQAEEVLAITAG